MQAPCEKEHSSEMTNSLPLDDAELRLPGLDGQGSSGLILACYHLIPQTFARHCAGDTIAIL